MKRFTALYTAIDQSTKTSVKVGALAEYFREAPDPDKLWTVALFSGRRPRRAITTTRLREWAAERAGIPLWLFEEAYPIVGDLAETIALVLPSPARDHDRSLSDWIGTLRALDKEEDETRKEVVLDAWDQMSAPERLVFNKLLTGGFRVGVSRKLMTRALAQATGSDEAELAHRLMGEWRADTTTWQNLIEAPDASADLSRPYPFCLAYGLDDMAPEDLGPPEDWGAEWKWDGIRGQLILRGGEHFVWSRGEELMTDRFPEFARARDFLPNGTVIDGEIVAWDGAAPLPFNALQKRIGRKSVPKKVLTEAPVLMVAYDLLEQEDKDMRGESFETRRAALDALLAEMPDDAPLRGSQLVPFDTWSNLAEIRSGARDARAEGLMLKRQSSPYHIGRKKGDWWKWKLDPLTIDAV
ncbi:MAG: cisplatin damage response ATP-dependent DNA ligase, partial [Pseudomonadota bacterium]